jgi:hypothetical protein
MVYAEKVRNLTLATEGSKYARRRALLNVPTQVEPIDELRCLRQVLTSSHEWSVPE